MGWYMTVEKLLKAEIPKRAQYVPIHYYGIISCIAEIILFVTQLLV